jgi:Bacteriocin-protection, YdeI or OmpD-Associated/Domain of unknown function (DUF1905)
MAQKTYRFQAPIYRIWMMRHVDVPNDIAHALQTQLLAAKSARDRSKSGAKYIPVVALVNGKHARTTLVPAGGGRFRMQINTALRKAAHADAGDLVGVELRLDRESRDLPVPADFAAGLKQHPKAWRAFEALAPGHRRHIIAYFDSAKSPAARNRRLTRAIDALLERALLGPKRQHSREGNHRATRRTRIAK